MCNMISKDVFLSCPFVDTDTADQRDYLPLHIPLLKRLSGKEKDWICQIDSRLIISGVLKACVRKEDRFGRILPVWRGCLRLAKHQIFVIGDHLASFDSRVLGPLHRDSIPSVARPFWINKKGHGPHAEMSGP